MDEQCVLPRPYRGKPTEWAHEHIRELPPAYAIGGRFDLGNSPWIGEPIDSCADPLIRRTTISKAVQSAGTLAAEIVACFRIANDPGPATFTMQTDVMAVYESKTRLMPLLESIPVCARVLPRVGPNRTTTEIIFPGGSFFILNEATVTAQQSQSVRYKTNDEIWLKKWADVYVDACMRVTAFEEQGISHILDVSQGGFMGDHAETSFDSGTREEWSGICQGCGKSMFLHIRQDIQKDGSWLAGMVWDRGALGQDGMWDKERAAETVRFKCIHCGHEHADTDELRAHWKKTGHYVVTNPKPPKDWRSFHWEALVARPMRLLVKEWCDGENHFRKMGDESLRQKFRQKREARSWKQTTEAIVIEGGSNYTVEQYWNGEKVEGELFRFMTIDRQMTHFWVEVRAVTATECLQLYFGRIDTIDQVRATQQRYKVPDTCTAEDRRYDASKVDQDCARFGWRGMMGHPRKTWTMSSEETGQPENFPHSDPKTSSMTGAIFYEFSSSHCKDVVANGIRGDGGLKWRQPKNGNPLYAEHLAAEEKRETKSGVWTWVEVKQNHNHGFDTSAMLAAILIIAGLVRLKLDSEK